jgi:hypothetical protein
MVTKIILNKAYETLYCQVPKSFMENAKMESVLLNINVSKKCLKNYKNGKNLYLSNSKTIVIKSMNLVVSCFYHLCHLCCEMVCVHLAMLYGETNYIYHKLILHGFTQPKHNYKLIIINFNLGIFN